MEAVISYECTCGQSMLVCLGSDENARHADSDAREETTPWNETVRLVADRIGVPFLSPRERATFVCGVCSTLHVVADALGSGGLGI